MSKPVDLDALRELQRYSMVGLETQKLVRAAADELALLRRVAEAAAAEFEGVSDGYYRNIHSDALWQALAAWRGGSDIDDANVADMRLEPR